MPRKRYAQVGLGGRSAMFTQAITKSYAESCELVGLCDSNPGRLRLAAERLPEGYPPVATYPADEFDRMIAERKPDAVIVTTMDRFHHEYIVRALDAGCDAVTEKPMTIDAEKCQQIVDAVKRTGRSVRVTFNYRYAPPRSQVKDLLIEGAIGRVLSVDFHWMLDTQHGADYYRRWHRNRRNSGGFIVHKATHHFDLVNWWLGTIPVEVFARGKREFYTPATAERYGLQGRAERCHGCPVSGKCRFFLDIAASPNMKALYLDNEQHDGYFRDRCVWGEDIDIEDTMTLVVRYRSGALMSYSLNSFSPWEGYVISFNGTKGRLEHKTTESTYVSGDGRVPGATVEGGSHVRVYPHFETMYEPPLRTGKGGHGGGDSLLLGDLLDPDAPPDALMRAADYRSGAYSILTGVAANASIASGKPVRIDSLVKGIPDPDYPPMRE